VWGDDGVVMIQGNIVGGSILVGLVQWQAFSPYFGDAVVKLQVRAGNIRHRIADHFHLHRNSVPGNVATSEGISVQDVQLDRSPATINYEKGLLPTPATPGSATV
jgi:hypothetical protein